MSSDPSGRAGSSPDGGGELHEPAELPRHLPPAGRQAASVRRAERTAEVPDGPGARCVSDPAPSPVTGVGNVIEGCSFFSSF